MSASNQRIAALRGRWLPAPTRERLVPPEDDLATAALRELAAAVLERAPHVLRDLRRASQTAVHLQAYRDLADTGDRAWQFAFRSNPGYCVLGEDGERELLRLIVGGAPHGRLSEIERRITGEAVGRLFHGIVDDGAWNETRRERPLGSSWSCGVDLSTLENAGALLELFMRCSPPPAKGESRLDLTKVALPLRATISSGSCDIASIARWENGSLVKLQRGLDVIAIVFAGGRRIAHAQLGSLHGERALLLTALWPRG